MMSARHAVTRHATRRALERDRLIDALSHKSTLIILTAHANSLQYSYCNQRTNHCFIDHQSSIIVSTIDYRLSTYIPSRTSRNERDCQRQPIIIFNQQLYHHHDHLLHRRQLARGHLWHQTQHPSHQERRDQRSHLTRPSCHEGYGNPRESFASTSPNTWRSTQWTECGTCRWGAFAAAAKAKVCGA